MESTDHAMARRRNKPTPGFTDSGKVVSKSSKDDGTPGRTFGEERVRSVIELELFLESRFSRFCLTEEDD